MHTLNKLNTQVKMDPHLLREIQAFIKFSTDTEKEEKNALVDDLPLRLRNRLSLYIFNIYRDQVSYLSLISDKRDFIIWITPKLKEIQMIQGSYMQLENESLTHIHFILQG